MSTLAATVPAAATFNAGDPSGTKIATISGLTPGSALDLFPNDGRVLLSGRSTDGTTAYIVPGPTMAAAGPIAVSLVETDRSGAATNSPRVLACTVTVNADTALGASPPVYTATTQPGDTVATITGLRANEAAISILNGDRRFVLNGTGTAILAGLSKMQPGVQPVMVITNMGRTLWLYVQRPLVVVGGTPTPTPVAGILGSGFWDDTATWSDSVAFSST